MTNTNLKGMTLEELKAELKKVNAKIEKYLKEEKERLNEAQ